MCQNLKIFKRMIFTLNALHVYTKGISKFKAMPFYYSENL